MPAQPPPNPRDPQPLAGVHADALTPQLPPENLNSDINDELTDHLSLSARDLQLAGHTPGEANQLAHQKFGDLAAIRRRLWWIQKGDELMLRTALAIVCAVLVLAVAALGIGNWRMSRTIDDLQGTLAAINENQKKITDAQESILAAQEANRPLTIQGRLYNGDPSKPAPGAAVHLYRLSDRKLIDKYTADAQGQFTTAPLAPDRYFVVAPLLRFNPLEASATPRPEPSPPTGPRADYRAYFAGLASQKERARPLFGIQSEPIVVSVDGQQSPVNLDVQSIPVGQVSFDPPRDSLSIHWPDSERPRGRELSDELLRWQKQKYDLASKLHDKGIEFPSGLHSVLRIVTVKQGPELPDLSAIRTGNAAAWPVRGIYGGGYVPTQAWGGHISSEMLFLRRLGYGFDLCEAGKYRFVAFITLQEFNPGGSARAVSRSDDRKRISLKREDRERVAMERMKALPNEVVQEIEVQENKRTHLRLIAPTDFDKEVLTAMENAANQEEFDAVFGRVWPVQVEQLGYEEMVLTDVER